MRPQDFKHKVFPPNLLPLFLFSQTISQVKLVVQRVNWPAKNISESTHPESPCAPSQSKWEYSSTNRNNSGLPSSHLGHESFDFSQFQSFGTFSQSHSQNIGSLDSFLNFPALNYQHSQDPLDSFIQSGNWPIDTGIAGLGNDFGPAWPSSDASIFGIDPSSSLSTDFHTSSLHDSLAVLDPGTDLYQYQFLNREQEMSPINTTHTPSSLETPIQDSSPSAPPSPPRTDRTPGPPVTKSPSPANNSPTEHRSHTSKDKIQKRTLNTLAARRYRQKRLDQVQNLEDALKETQSERDALKVRVARLEGEVEVLRGLLKR